ncbi:flavodoxin family protein [Pseudovibrio brasiliensis]|uniref:Flavodoxin family protein n=1 Tax=Pseudovibrio brasiliensis TaxID=1898042 RepID=A0ABX8ANS3_9HYPH|nr:flavodoxin family protein [Pseudovibrio brasiliensis]QUS56385.1 flavodoxin family protein [Pseudovibrio brasiliensis]
MSKVIVVYHSGYGHTQVLAEAVLRGALDAGADAELMSVAELENVNWEKLAAADALIFGSPTYMGSASAPFKAFMDASSKVWMERGWVDKVAGAFTVSASRSGDKLGTLTQLSVFAAQHGMIWVGLDLMPGNNSSKGSEEDLNRLGSTLGVMAQANADEGPEVVPPQADKDTAKALGGRIAKVAAALTRESEAA